MPGINLIYDWNKDVAKWNNLFSKAQHLVKHNHEYTKKTLFYDDRCIIGYTKYDSYPMSLFDLNDYKVIIDGVIYNKDIKTVQSELSNIASLLDSNSDEIREEIEGWILNTDGEYNVIFYDLKKQNLYLFNDVLGRLPIYYYVNGKIFVLSREISFITPFVDKITFDKDILAEYLLFSAPLEDSTLISGVRRLRSSTLLKISSGDKDLSFLKIYVFNLDKRDNAAKSVKTNTAELRNIFLDACWYRIQSFKQPNIVVSLSGGLDSRAVALALKEIGASYSATTFINNEKSTYADDAEIAKIIADKLQIPWTLFEQSKDDIEDIEKLLQYKSGLNHVYMNFILQYFEDIKRKYGTNILFWTGDEGNASLAYNCPARQLHNTDEVVNHIIERHGITNLKRIKMMLDIDEQKLRYKIKNIVDRYPENELNNKYLHFFFFEYLYKLQYEGEDRNRIFFWSVAPMYSIQFFNYALNIPDNQKKHHNLYREFLNKLSPEVARIRNANWHYPVTAKGRLIMEPAIKKTEAWFLNKLPSTFRKIIRQIVATKRKTYRSAPELEEYLINLFKTETMSRVFLDSGLKAIRSGDLTKGEFWNLLTLVAFISKTEKELKDSSIAVS